MVSHQFSANGPSASFLTSFTLRLRTKKRRRHVRSIKCRGFSCSWVILDITSWQANEFGTGSSGGLLVDIVILHLGCFWLLMSCLIGRTTKYIAWHRLHHAKHPFPSGGETLNRLQRHLDQHQPIVSKASCLQVIPKS